MECIAEQYKVDRWIKELNTLNEVFLTEKENFSNELCMISNWLKFLETTRINVALIGQSKAGKSMILNALIGKKLLQSSEHNCTFFGLKIQPHTDNSVLFPTEINRDQWIFGDENVQKKIQEINEQERNKKKIGIMKSSFSKTKENIWTLKTFMKAYEREKTKTKLKEELRFLEFCDLPGISDDIINWSPEDIKTNMNEIYSYEEKTKKSRKNIENLKFNLIFREINPQILILVLDVNKMKDMESFITYFQESLFQGKERAKIKNILENNNVMILINKADEIKKNNTKDLVLEMVFQSFASLTKSENTNLKEEPRDDYFKRVNIFFVSAKIAQESVFLTNERETKLRNQYLILKKESEYIEKEVSKQKEKFKNQTDYNAASNFEDFLENLQNKIKKVFSEQIATNTEELIIELKQRKNGFLDKKEYLQDNPNGFLKENIKNNNFEKRFSQLLEENEKQFQRIIDNIYKKFENNRKILSEFDPFILKEKYFDFVDNCSETILEAYKQISENFKIYANELSNIFKPTPKFQAFIYEKIIYDIKNCQKKLNEKKDENLYGFLPNDINYFKYWIFRKIVAFFTNSYSFLQQMRMFFERFDRKFNKHIRKELEKHYNKYFKEPAQKTINDSLRLLRGKYAD